MPKNSFRFRLACDFPALQLMLLRVHAEIRMHQRIDRGIVRQSMAMKCAECRCDVVMRSIMRTKERMMQLKSIIQTKFADFLCFFSTYQKQIRIHTIFDVAGH